MANFMRFLLSNNQEVTNTSHNNHYVKQVDLQGLIYFIDQFLG